jgi:predicted RNase H-like HicB family nuclease
MTQKFTVIVEQGEDGYLISDVIELSGCHSQAKTYDELIERTKEAISLYLEVKGIPEVKSKFLSLQQVEVELGV